MLQIFRLKAYQLVMKKTHVLGSNEFRERERGWNSASRPGSGHQDFDTERAHKPRRPRLILKRKPNPITLGTVVRSFSQVRGRQDFVTGSGPVTAGPQQSSRHGSNP
jgi:hypothetical protein